MRIIGVGVLRSLVFVLCGSLIGAGLWRYMMAGARTGTVLPAAVGVLGIFLLTVGSIQAQAADIWAEFLWSTLIALAAFVLYRRTLDQAVATDTMALGATNERMVCPACHRVTPNSTYCAYCGHRLTPEAATSEPTREDSNFGQNQ